MHEPEDLGRTLRSGSEPVECSAGSAGIPVIPRRWRCRSPFSRRRRCWWRGSGGDPVGVDGRSGREGSAGRCGRSGRGPASLRMVLTGWTSRARPLRRSSSSRVVSRATVTPMADAHRPALLLGALDEHLVGAEAVAGHVEAAVGERSRTRRPRALRTLGPSPSRGRAPGGWVAPAARWPRCAEAGVVTRSSSAIRSG